MTPEEERRIERFRDAMAEDVAYKVIYGPDAQSPFLKWWIANKAAYPKFGVARDAWDTMQARSVQ